MAVNSKPHVVDLHAVKRHENATEDDDIRQQIISGLTKPPGEKHIPTIVLYDERGLRLYDVITVHVPEYYLFAAEESILKNHADQIVQAMYHHKTDNDDAYKSIVLELGAGALRKTSHILLALARLVPPGGLDTPDKDPSKAPITYYALDLEKSELERTLQMLIDAHGDAFIGKINARGIWGTYNDGLQFVESGGLTKEIESDVTDLDTNQMQEKGGFCEPRRVTSASGDSPRSSDSESIHTHTTYETRITPPSTPGADNIESGASVTPICILFLGSSLGNFNREESISFLRSLPLRAGSGDTLLIGMDHDNAKDKVELAYNDPQGITEDFIMNGLRVAGRALGDENLLKNGEWKYVNRYNESERRHEAYYKSMTEQSFIIPHSRTTVSIRAGELVNIEVSHKYSDEDAYTLFTSSQLRPIIRWTDAGGQYSLWLLERPDFTFPLLKSPGDLKSAVVPHTSGAFVSNAFGTPTLEDFRTMWKAWDCITMGMIPSSMLFTRPIHLRHICLFYLGHIPTFLDIHLSRLLQEQHTEPEYFKNIFERGIDPHVDDPTQCHPHSEVPQRDEDWPTLQSIVDFRDRVRARLARLYDDIASGRRKMTRSMGRVLFMTLEHEGFHAETLLYMLLQKTGEPDGTLPPPGFSTPPWESLAEQWDASLPLQELTVTLGPSVITLGHDDLESDDKDSEKMHLVDGVEFGWDNEHPKREVVVEQFRISWRPVTNGEYFEFWKTEGHGVVEFPPSWIEMDGEVQVRTLYGPIPMNIARHWPVLTSYDDLSKYAKINGGRLPTEAELCLFLNKFASGYEGGANVGFRNWHPLPATTGGTKANGRGHNGGVWEWTSTILDAHDGFVQSDLYPGYSADFFDGKHQVVIGGSYATIPRIAERKTLRNYYQHNYPYAWVGGRVVYET